MHSPQRMHFCRNLSSGRAPGGRINFGEARFDAGEKRKKGTTKRPKSEEKISFLRERLTFLIFSAALFTGKSMALVGQIAPQVKQ